MQRGANGSLLILDAEGVLIFLRVEGVYMDKKTVNMREAAEALNCSTDTIRRRIKQKRLRAEKVNGPYGPEWEINLNSLKEAQNIIETIPVKHNLEPEEFESLMRKAANEGTRDAIRAEISEAMQDYAAQMQELKNTIEQLQKQLNEQPKESFLKRLFKGG